METGTASFGPDDLLRNAAWMRRLALSLARDESAAADLLQETWLKALERPDAAREPSRGWLRTVLRNFAYRRIRSERRRQSRELRAARPEAEGSPPDRLLERVELERRVVGFVLRLDEPYRSTVLLRFFEGLEPAEIARRQQVAEATVRSRLSRALERLRGKLDRAHGGSRAAWALVLLPASLAGTASTLTAAPAVTGAPLHWILGGLLMTKKIVVPAVLALLLTAAAVLWIAFTGSLPEPEKMAERAPAGDPAVAAARVRTGGAAGAKNAADSAQPTSAKSAAGIAGPPSLEGKITTAGTGLAGATVVAIDARAWEELLARGSDRLAARGNGDLTGELRDLGREFSRRFAEAPRTLSGSDGVYRIRGLREGEHRVLALHPRHLPRWDGWAAVEGSAAARCDLELSPAAAISGRVLGPDGAPVAGATVAARPARERQLSGEEKRRALLLAWTQGRLPSSRDAETDASGRFEVGSIEPGLYDVVARREQSVEARAADIATGTTGLELRLTRGAALTGRLADPGEKPAAGVELSLRPLGEDRPAPAELGKAMLPFVASDQPLDAAARLTSTDAEGRFTFAALSPGRWLLEAKPAGFPPLEIEVRLGGEDQDLGVLLLERPLAIAGRVVDGRGRPVEGAEVWVEDAPREGTVDWGERLEAADPRAKTRSGPRGAFRIDGLPAGTFTLRASSSEHLPLLVAGIPAGGREVVLRLEEGGLLHGVVVDGESGAPLGGASLELLANAVRQAVPAKSAVTGPDGRFEFRGVPEGQAVLTLRASHPDFPGRPAATGLGGRDRRDPIRIEIWRPHRVEGRAVTAAGGPAAGARVRLVCQEQDLVEELGPGRATARAESDGSFALAIPRNYLSSGVRIEVAASHPTLGAGFAPLLAAGKDGWSPIEIVLASTARLQGRVTAPDGKPLAGALVRAMRELPFGSTADLGLERTATSGPDGSYRIEGLERGSYRVESRGPGQAPRADTGVEIVEEELVLDLVLEPGASIAGRVVDPSGSPVRGAEVLALEPEPGDGEPLPASAPAGSMPAQHRSFRRERAWGMASATSGDDGAYLIRDLPPGTVTLVARAPGFTPSDLTPAAPGRRAGDLVVSPLASLSGVVVDARSGAALAPFRLHLGRKEEGRSPLNAGILLPRWYEDPRGRFLVEGIGAGTWVAAVRAAGHRPGSAEVVLRPGEKATLKIALEPGAAVRGAVRERETGRPIAEAIVRCQAVERSAVDSVTLVSPSEITGSDGSFVFAGLEPGEHGLYAHHPDYFPEEETYRIAASDDEPALVEVFMSRAGKLAGRVAMGPDSGATMELRAAGERRLLRARVENDGRYLLAGIPPGTYQASLRSGVWREREGREPTWEERVKPLGTVEILAGQTATLDP